MKQVGLIGTLVGGFLAVLGGLLAWQVYAEHLGMQDDKLAGAIGLYFLGKGIAVAGIGLLGFEQGK